MWYNVGYSIPRGHVKGGVAESGGILCAVKEDVVVEEEVALYHDDLEEDPCGGVCVGVGGGEGVECESEAADVPSGEHEYIVGTIVTVGTVCSPFLLGDRSQSVVVE